jgi:hypothetical protein
MNTRVRRLKVRPQNKKVAKAFKKKQNMKIELNKKWLPVVYLVMLIICIFLNITNSNVDLASVLVNAAMFLIVGLIFIYAYRRLSRIDKMGEDFYIAISYIKQDYAQRKCLLWDEYKTDSRYGIFNESHLRNTYIDYVEEMNRLEQESPNKYRCDIEDFINYHLIDDSVEKGRLSLIPGAMTGLGILGTFVGLSLGLQAFNTGSADEIANSIGPLMDGIKVAFHTSIYGMIFSLTFNLIFKSVLEKAYGKLDEFIAEFKRYVCPDAEHDNKSTALEYQRLQIEATKEAQKAMEDSLIPYLKNICELQQEQNELLKQSIKG